MWAEVVADRSFEELADEDRERRIRSLETDGLIQAGALDDVHIVRIVEPNEWAQTQVDCMADHGFVAEAADGGTGLLFPEDVPRDQVQTFNLAVFDCRVRYPLNPLVSQTPPVGALEVLYEYLVQEMLPCVRGHGYDVAEPPSKELWIDQYSAGMAVWTPADAPLTDIVDEDRRETTLRECPRYPEWFYPAAPR